MVTNARGYGLNFCETKFKNMNKKIELTIEDKHHNSMILTNEKGDTFTFDPMINEGLSDFLSGAKILSIADVSNSVCLSCKSKYKDKGLPKNRCIDCGSYMRTDC